MYKYYYNTVSPYNPRYTLLAVRFISGRPALKNKRNIMDYKQRFVEDVDAKAKSSDVVYKALKVAQATFIGRIEVELRVLYHDNMFALHFRDSKSGIFYIMQFKAPTGFKSANYTDYDYYLTDLNNSYDYASDFVLNFSIRVHDMVSGKSQSISYTVRFTKYFELVTFDREHFK
jgi:hypothetical protein